MNAPEASPGDASPPPLPAQPAFWLFVAVAGLMAVCIGVVIDVYRHNNGADPGSLISADNPGALLALVGFALTTVGVLTAASILAFQDADTPASATRRGIVIAAAWASVSALSVAAVTYVAVADVTIGHAGHNAVVASTPTATASATAVATLPGIERRAVLRGSMTLDGAPVNAEFSGVRVVRDGLVNACQLGVDPVVGGRYEVVVLADAEVRGCGKAGAGLVLWIFVNERFMYSAETRAWPGDGANATFDATFSTATPDGAAVPVTEVFGRVTRSSEPVPAGTLIEAYVGNVLCAVTSLRPPGDFEGYALHTAGPKSVDGCATGATLTFRVDGVLANETAVNDLAGGRDAHELNLTVD